MKSWDEGADFRELVTSDKDIAAHLSREQIEAVFSLKKYLKNVDEVFARVFGAAGVPEAAATGSMKT
jgi:adenylosuccinate lyase